MTSFANKKRLRFVITIGTDKFNEAGDNQITLEGFRSSIDIDKAGGMMMGTLKARIYGVKQADMNAITTLMWRPNATVKNTVQVTAIDGDQETLVFAGNIVNAWGDYQHMPDVFLYIHSQSAYFGGLTPVRPISIPGGIDVKVVMERIAKELGLSFENNNVSITLTDVYLANTPKEQALELSRAGNFDLYIDDKVLAITNRYSPRAGDIPEISSQSGMMGYPTFDSTGVVFHTLFNPAITFGGSFKLTTDNERAAGQWIVTSIAHRLEAEKPGGAWFSTVRGNANGLAITH